MKKLNLKVELWEHKETIYQRVDFETHVEWTRRLKQTDPLYASLDKHDIPNAEELERRRRSWA